jgi:hypothetical protein
LNWAGPGNAYQGTNVDVRQGKKPSQDVLFFSHQDSTMNLKMTWLTPTHLDVQYGPWVGDSVSLDFWVAQTGGISISVQRLGGQPRK